jgi:hypothetical protein
MPLFCLTLPATHGDPKPTAKQIAIAENTGRRFATVQSLIVAANDEASPLILSNMERTFGFAGAIPASDVSTRWLTWYDWLFQRNASENLK